MPLLQESPCRKVESADGRQKEWIPIGENLLESGTRGSAKLFIGTSKKADKETCAVGKRNSAPLRRV